MIVITGAAGFIGSNLAAKLIQENYKDIVLVDDFSNKNKEINFINRECSQLVDREEFEQWIDQNHKLIQFIFHIGARTDTAEFDMKVLDKLNTDYSKMVWRKCCSYGIPLIYASSAATYGLGELGYVDDHDIVENLKPLNPYGISKNEFDKWALSQKQKPYFWAGIKFFNVYGPNEYHKGRMASVIFHAYHQIMKTGKLKLFKSHNPLFKDGEQKRDFIYVKDVVNVLFYMMLQRKTSGIFNLGTGKARTFIELGTACFNAMNRKPEIYFVDTPEDIRDKYQYFTEADMAKLKQINYHCDFYSLENGIRDYIKNYLEKGKYE